MKYRSGFSLIEVMTVLAIMGILAAIVYPTYISSIQKSARAAAKNTMTQVSQREERYFTENNKYASLTAIGYSAATVYSDNNTHAITIAAGTTALIDTSFVISAVPQRTDSICGTLTLNNVGTWTNSVGGPPSTC